MGQTDFFQAEFKLLSGSHYTSPGSCVGTAWVSSGRRRREDKSPLSPTTDTSLKNHASIKLHPVHLNRSGK